VKIVTLLDKPEGRVVDIEADYVGFDVPNEFVVGYGLDYAEAYRNLAIHRRIKTKRLSIKLVTVIAIKLCYNRMVRIDKKLLNLKYTHLRRAKHEQKE
jgi:hypothetical protein